MQRMRDPDFLIIGAQKCSTTSLFKNLDAHPDVGMHTFRHPGSAYETNYFTHHYKTKSLEWYRAGFPQDATIVGEKTPDYHFGKATMLNILSIFPNVKLLFLIRDPVARFHSARSMRLAQNPDQDLSLDTIFNNEQLKREYLFRGCYAAHIHWLPDFALKNLLVRPVDKEYRIVRANQNLSREMGAPGGVGKTNASAAVYEDVCRFLGIPVLPIDAKDYWVSNWQRTPLTAEEDERLREFYAKPNEKLRELYGIAFD